MKYEGIKYKKLNEYLLKLENDKKTLTFADIEQIIETKLPDSAHKYNAYWANVSHQYRQSGAWISAGWKVVKKDLDSKEITFKRKDAVKRE
ncbi:MAG: hypothetical protein LBT66_08955 [Methanobrevibacter sp.]|jgi:hypothetical protein|nr:hypothetical protein [Candidatus Methanovirga meridionalis]